MRGVQKPLQISENFYLGSNSAGATATRLVFEERQSARFAVAFRVDIANGHEHSWTL